MHHVPIGRRTALVGLLTLAVTSVTLAQTNWSIEGSKPSYGEYNAPACLVAPPPPYAVNPPPVPGGGCPTFGMFPPLSCRGGGTGVDNNGNFLSGGPAFPVVINTDGFTITMSTPAGAYVNSWPVPPGAILPGPISGLDYNSATDVIWISDGFFCAGLGLVPGCPIPPIAFPPFPIPSCSGAPTCGLGYSPCTGTLWSCDVAGVVTNFTTAGGFLSCFLASPPLAPILTGLTVNSTNGNIQVTDGFLVAEFTPAGALAVPGAFYLAANPYPIPLWAAPVDGLGFSLRPQNYGVGCSPIGPPPTIMFGGGYPFAGNGGFTVGETGAAPGAMAFLIFSLTRACPPLPIAGCPGTGLWIAPPFGGILFVGIVGGGGTVVVPAPIPGAGACGPPVGVPIYLQFVNKGGPIPPGKVQLTDALSFTIGAI
ncbi:MAG: hypothetical protein U1E76_06165 [Planctomycetota bacterium]